MNYVVMVTLIAISTARTGCCMEQDNTTNVDLQVQEQEAAFSKLLLPADDEQYRAQKLHCLSTELDSLCDCYNALNEINPIILLSCDDKEQAEVNPLVLAMAIKNLLSEEIIYCGPQAKKFSTHTNKLMNVVDYYVNRTRYILIVRNLKIMYEYFKYKFGHLYPQNETDEEFIKYLHTFAPEKKEHALLAGIHTPDIQQIPPKILEYFGNQIRNSQNLYAKHLFCRKVSTKSSALQSARISLPIKQGTLIVPSIANCKLLLFAAIQKFESIGLYNKYGFIGRLSSTKEIFTYLEKTLSDLSDAELIALLDNLPIKKSLSSYSYSLDLRELSDQLDRILEKSNNEV